MIGLQEAIDRHEEDIAALREKQASHAQRIEGLDAAMSELSIRFGTVSTKDDIIKLNEKIDKSVNGLLKDALASVPQNALVVFTAILAFIALIDLVIKFAPHG